MKNFLSISLIVCIAICINGCAKGMWVPIHPEIKRLDKKIAIDLLEKSIMKASLPIVVFSERRFTSPETVSIFLGNVNFKNYTMHDNYLIYDYDRDDFWPARKKARIRIDISKNPSINPLKYVESNQQKEFLYSAKPNGIHIEACIGSLRKADESDEEIFKVRECASSHVNMNGQVIYNDIYFSSEADITEFLSIIRSVWQEIYIKPESIYK